MTIKRRLIIIAITSLLSMNISASESSLVAFGKAVKDKFYDTVSTQVTKPAFPALYIYDTNKQAFLTKQQAQIYLGKLDSSEIWQQLLNNWLRDSSQFKTSNTKLNQAIPDLKTDRDYIVFYDNLPKPMLEQFKTMEPNLIEKDEKLKAILSKLQSSRSYTTY